MEAINLSSLLKDKNAYESMLSEIYENTINSNIENKNIIRQVLVNNEFISMTTGKLYVNMLFFSIFIGMDITITKNDLFLDKNATPNSLEKMFNHILELAIANGITVTEYTKRISNVHNMLNKVSCKTAKKVGPSLDIIDFINLEASDKNARRLMNVKLTPNMQYDETEKVFNTLNKIFEYIITEKHPEIGMAKLLSPKTGVNTKQMAQSFVFGGLKPDIFGNIINHAIESSYYHGLSNDLEHFIDCEGTRNALIQNHNMVSVAGYLTQKLTLLLMDAQLSDVEDCKTEHPILYDVVDEDHLKFIDDRYYHPIKNGKIDFKTLNYINTNNSNTKKLIGERIALRSPATCCASKDGRCVCKTCYGKKLYEVNKNKHPGILSVLFITEILTQMLLSAKHLLTTNARKIDWGEAITNNFDIAYDTIMLSEDSTAKITIPSITSDDYDDNFEAYVVNAFELFIDGQTIQYDAPVTLYLNPAFVDTANLLVDSQPIIITQSKITEDIDWIFKFVQSNSALTTALFNIIDLIDNKEHHGCVNVHEMVNKFADLLLESNITASKINLVHCEMIVNQLIKSYKGGNVDWSKKELEPYQILRVSKAVMDMPLSISLAFERLAGQFADLATFNKTESSMYDEIYK